MRVQKYVKGDFVRIKDGSLWDSGGLDCGCEAIVMGGSSEYTLLTVEKGCMSWYPEESIERLIEPRRLDLIEKWMDLARAFQEEKRKKVSEENAKIHLVIIDDAISRLGLSHIKDRDFTKDEVKRIIDMFDEISAKEYCWQAV